MSLEQVMPNYNWEKDFEYGPPDLEEVEYYYSVRKLDITNYPRKEEKTLINRMLEINMESQNQTGENTSSSSSMNPEYGRLRTGMPSHSTRQFPIIVPSRILPGDLVENINNTRPRRGIFNRPIIGTLPQQHQEGSILELTMVDVQLWPELIDRWESDTLNAVNRLILDTPEDIISYIENLLGSSTKGYWTDWKRGYPDDYNKLVQMASYPANVTSQVRQIILGTEPRRGDTFLQDNAMRDLERLTIESFDNLIEFNQSYFDLATRTGRSWDLALGNKYFDKLPRPLGKIISDDWSKKIGNNTSGIASRMVFAMRYITDMCMTKEAEKQARDLSFCKKIYMPGNYGVNNKDNKKKFRRSKNYRKGSTRTNQVRKFKKHKPPIKKCKCYICGEIGHYANSCTNSRVKKDRINVYESLDLEPGYDIVSLDGEEDENDSEICSFCSLSDIKSQLEELQEFEKYNI